MRQRFISLLCVLPNLAVPALAEVVTSEFFSPPESEGWTLLQQFGDMTHWTSDGVYHQESENNCPPNDICGSEAYTRSIQQFVGSPTWFYEYRVSATGDSFEILAGAPTVFVAFNAFGEDYTASVASDRVKLFRDALLPILFIDVTPGEPHRIRVELANGDPPTYKWFIDSVLVDEGLAEDFFPSADARITWLGRTWMQPTLNIWFYIRAGDIPLDASADFNSDGAVDDFEVFYINECIERSAAGEPAAPSCTWADFNTDGTVDCDDWQNIADTLWTGANDPPPLINCLGPTAPIPAISQWGVLVLMLSLGIVGTSIFRRHHPSQG